MSFIPHTDAERAEMLAAVGVKQVADLFDDIPPPFRIKSLRMPEGLSESEEIGRAHV